MSDAMIDAPITEMPVRTELSTSIGQSRVLVAEGGAGMRVYLHRLLDEDGYEVPSVPDGETGVTAAKRQKPDLVLTEVILPRVDGLGLLSALRREPELRVVPIIVLSTSASGEARSACLRAGADNYLVTPCSAGDLLARVGAHLALSRLVQPRWRRCPNCMR